MRILLTVSVLLTLLMACNKGSGRNTTGDAIGGTTATPKDPGGTGTATSLEITPLSVSSLYTQDTSAASCVQIVVKTLNNGAPVADAGVTFTVQATGIMVDKGTITPDSGTSSASGTITSSYCSGKDVGSVVIIVKSGSISTNTSTITITKKPTYEFVYVRSDVDGAAISTTEGASVVTLNTLDSGPSDCTTLYFKLLKSAVPVAGQKITFGTQVDYPKGSKLAKKADPVQTTIETATGKKYATYTATSSGAGEFPVPVCAGVTLGTLLVSGSYTDPEEGRVYHAKSPVIRITAGLTNYTTFSLTFDVKNARTLNAFYNTNSEYDLPLTVQLGARYDGRALPDYPLTFATEVGRYTLDNGGTPDADAGIIKVKLHALHLVDNYPYPVTNFGTAYPAAQTRCEPLSIATWAAANGVAKVPYSQLRMNWRSTAVYAVRGQEYYNDANHNGVYDEGGDGFWDKNQNGVYDAGDVITHDGGAPGFDPNGEWFIDLPTPFVDVDEDHVFDPSKDILLGDEYAAPNGKRDADAFIWKSEVFPIGMGPSAYGLMSHEILAGPAYNPPASRFVNNGLNTYVNGLPSLVDNDLWPGYSTDTDRLGVVIVPFTVFAHDLCGNLLPGGTKLAIDFEVTHAMGWGHRDPVAHIYTQPVDTFLEPTRHLLKDADGGATALINFNSSDHPTNVDSYPVLSFIEIPTCTNQCTGVLALGNPGVSCDAWEGRVRMTVTEPSLDPHAASVTISNTIKYKRVSTCNCLNNQIIESQGVCRCPDPKDSWDDATNKCKAP
ncbi:MAG: hypothetical protein H7249_06845 [Chitinophagaceae bacterium]|nr:hypothetical protein [Oligoflexus sp.]